MVLKPRRRRASFRTTPPSPPAARPPVGSWQGSRRKSRSGEETLVRTVPADGLAPRFGLACRARRRLCSALHAAQVAHHGEWEIARVSGIFHSVYEAAEQVGHAKPD